MHIDPNIPLPPPRTFLVQPRTPAGRHLKAPMFVPGEFDPVLSPNRKPVSFCSISLSGIITVSFFYAIGDLPEVSQLFSRVNVYLQSQNDAIVTALVAAAPYIGTAIFGLSVGCYIVLHYNRMRRRPGRRTPATA